MARTVPKWRKSDLTVCDTFFLQSGHIWSLLSSKTALIIPARFCCTWSSPLTAWSSTTDVTTGSGTRCSILHCVQQTSRVTCISLLKRDKALLMVLQNVTASPHLSRRSSGDRSALMAVSRALCLLLVGCSFNSILFRQCCKFWTTSRLSTSMSKGSTARISRTKGRVAAKACNKEFVGHFPPKFAKPTQSKPEGVVLLRSKSRKSSSANWARSVTPMGAASISGTSGSPKILKRVQCTSLTSDTIPTSERTLRAHPMTSICFPTNVAFIRLFILRRFGKIALVAKNVRSIAPNAFLPAT
mmetsp:Transcript_4430/g.7840  ORF Transcript_4430/g.7840 Transcript_4430/m.7840 type:complete len:300 (-) Transcript_4430:3178-4077(-)